MPPLPVQLVVLVAALGVALWWLWAPERRVEAPELEAAKPLVLARILERQEAAYLLDNETTPCPECRRVGVHWLAHPDRLGARLAICPRCARMRFDVDAAGQVLVL